MATIIGAITVGGIVILQTDVNPSLSAGLQAASGSIVSAIDGSGMFYKSGSGATAWSNMHIVATMVPEALTITASTTINATNRANANFYATSSATALALDYSNFPNGSTITIDYLKTTATNLVITFPTGTVISASGNCTVAGLTATLYSTINGRFTISIVNMNGVFKSYIVQDVA